LFRVPMNALCNALVLMQNIFSIWDFLYISTRFLICRISVCEEVNRDGGVVLIEGRYLINFIKSSLLGM